MAFKNADRFGYTITLPFGEHSYRISSPPVDVGNFMVETTQLTGKRIALLARLDGLAEDDPEREDIERQLEEVTDVLTIPDEMEGDYFRAVLGPAYDETTDDQRAARAARGVELPRQVGGRKTRVGMRHEQPERDALQFGMQDLGTLLAERGAGIGHGYAVLSDAGRA